MASGQKSQDCSITEIVSALQSQPVRLHTAAEAPPPGVPPRRGLYAWWLTDARALPAVPRTRHPDQPLSLLYVGIASSRPTSKANLRSRVLGQHVRGNLSASTFRRSLAALLWREHGWTPRLTRSGRLTFDAADNAALLRWQHDHLRVAWCAVEEPWLVEHEVLRQMHPPLNVDANAVHPFHPSMRKARAELMAEARRNAEQS